MVTLSDIKSGTTTIQNASDWLDQSAIGYIVRPYTAKGIGGFLFSTREDDRVELRADITDYVSESNKTFQTHIGLKPMTTTLRGFIGEIADNRDDHIAGAGIVNETLAKLSAVTDYLPTLTTAGQQAKDSTAQNSSINIIDKINNYATNAQNLAGAFGVTLPGITKQEQAFNTLKSMFMSRQIITVETPWGYFDSMAISSIVAEQDSKSKMISDITVTLKQMQFVNLIQRKPTQEEIHLLQELGLSVNSDTNTPTVTTSNAPWSNSKNGGSSLGRALSAML